jgi:hypothetical protein
MPLQMTWGDRINDTTKLTASRALAHLLAAAALLTIAGIVFYVR